MARSTKRRVARCVCGGGQAHHTVEPECWCPNCLRLPEAERCQRFDPVTEIAEDPTHHRQKGPQPRGPKITAREVQAIPRKGTLKRQVFDLIGLHQGCTDDELENLTGRSHQSVSAVRNSLMNDLLIVDSGIRRETRYGNDAVVWVRDRV